MDIPALVVDSSVAHKWFRAENEDNVDVALALLRKHQTGEALIVVPAHMPSEVMNSLRYSRFDATALRKAAHVLLDAGLLVAPLDAELLSAAGDLALAYDLTVYDALFPALAVQLDSELVTADRAQARVRECPVRLLA